MSSEEKYSTDELTGKKAASAFRTIGEAAEELDVPQHVLRFWEKRFNQLEPVKRRGRRYYRPEDITLLQQIKALLYKEGYTIKGVQKYLLSEAFSADSQPDLFNASKAEPQAIKANNDNVASDSSLQVILDTLCSAREQLKQVL